MDMIISIVSIWLTLTFVFLSSIHIYWALGGRWGYMGAIPTNPDGTLGMFGKLPGPLPTLAVAFGLILVAIHSLRVGGWVQFSFLENYNTLINYLLIGIFTLRSLGDFKYCGITKKIKGTTFAKNDNKYFIPICLSIAILFAGIQFLS